MATPLQTPPPPRIHLDPKPPPNSAALQPNTAPQSSNNRRWWTLSSIKPAVAPYLSLFKINDWRRVAHSAKVGLALALVSLSVLLQDVFDKFGHNALWAILTVVVIFEYTVGATLSKGLNRGLGTIMAASIGLLVDYLANFVGAKIEPYVVGCSVFLIGAIATYTRFVPSIKAKYDYGVVIFLLTFCLVVISGYRVSDNIDLVFDRIVTVMVGIIICLLVSIFLFPIWAGDDLHNLIIQNFEGLAGSLEECLKEYFQGVQKLSRVSSKICKGQPYDDKIYKGYRKVLISKQTEESLATFASWEPRRGRFGCMYPWKRLVDVGAILRHCAYTVSALHGCVLSEIQAPDSLRKVFATSCMRIGDEVARVLREVAYDIKYKYKTKPKECMLERVREAIEELHWTVKTYPQFLLYRMAQNTIKILPEAREDNEQCPPMNYSVQGSHHMVQDNLMPINYENNHMVKGSHHMVQDNPMPINYEDLEVSSSLNPNPSPSPKSNPNPNQHLNPNVQIGILETNPISKAHLGNPNQDHYNIASGASVEALTGSIDVMGLINAKASNKPATTDQGHIRLMLHESMEFAESLSLASVITLLIEIVARLDHLLNAVVEFQEQAGFKKLSAHYHHDDDDDCHSFVDMNIHVDPRNNHHHANCSLNHHHPSSTSHVE